MIRSLGSLLIAGSLLFGTVSSFSNNSTYYLNSYSVGSGGATNISNSTYKGQASVGGVSNSNALPGSGNIDETGGLQAEQLAVPQAPTLSNGSNTYYNELGITLDNSMGTSTYPSDVTFAIEIATTSSFTSPSYVQTGGVLGASPFYQSYVSWGGSSGSFIVNLNPSTTYYVKVAAEQGLFTNTEFGPSASIATVSPSITFSESTNSLTLSSLLPNTVINTNPVSNITFNLSTNAAFGGNISVAGLYGGLHSSNNGNTIQSPTYGNSVDLSTATDGFGLQGVSTSGGLSIQAPYNVTSSNAGSDSATYAPVFSVTSPIPSGASATLAILAKASSTDPAASDYQETLTFIAAASF